MSLVEELIELQQSPVEGRVESRMSEFQSFVNRPEKDWFSELCFCILTANYTAQGAIRIQDEIGPGFWDLSEADLAGELRRLGHRFPNARAGYIVGAREVYGKLKEIVLGFDDGPRAREWILDIKGLGLKEASHFLRNVGFKDVAIIDRHILRLLDEHGYIETTKLTRKRYLEYEGILAGIGSEVGLDMARLDLYMWYMKTGKVLK